MTTTKWKDIAEIIALLAVVASLLVVAIELRQTQVALQAQAYQSRAFQEFDVSLHLADRPELSALLTRSMDKDFDVRSLSTVERTQLENLYYALRADVDNEHYQYQNGLLDRSFFETTTVEGIKRWAPVWRELGITETRPEFRALVDELISNPPKPDSAADSTN